jgi:pimeloyl-ACP methyl ester carboxylesterase
MTTTQSWTEEFVEQAGAKTQILKGGSGQPILLLHGANGNPGWMPVHEALSEKYTVYAPSHPGYDKSERPDWVSKMGDVAHFYLALMRSMGLEGVPIVGFSMGGWLAAEIAAMCPSAVKGLVLVGAVGIKPKVGDITEMLMVSPGQNQSLAYYDVSKAPNQDDPTPEQQNQLWSNREMASRLCWKPYMHNPNLPEYLKLISVPSLIIWGRQDGIVPLNCGEIYHEVLAGSTLRVIEECGHSPQTEKLQELLDVTRPFLSSL